MNKRKRAGIIVLVLIAVVMSFYFITRNFFLHAAFERVSEKLKKDYHAAISVTEIRFTGFSGITMRNLSITPEDGDTLLTVDSLYASPSLLSLLTGRIKLKKAAGSNLSLMLVCNNSICNYDSFLHHEKEKEESETAAGKNYASLLNRVVSRAFDLAPQEATFQQTNIYYVKNGRSEQVSIPVFISSDKAVEGSFINPADSSQWQLSGNFSQSKRTFDFKIYTVNQLKSIVPVLKSLVGAEFRFDTLHGVLDNYNYSAGLAKLSGNMTADHVFLDHPKISDEPAEVAHADFNFDISVGKNFFELDSSSLFVLNKLILHPYLRYENDESRKYELKMVTDNTPANDFFNSLPAGMFDELEGVEADGTLQYSLDFFLDSSQPDSLVFNSSLKKEKFRLKKSGRENLYKMNGEFLHLVYEHDRLMRSFSVGPSNPDFTPLENISPFFRNAVMTSEDGSFFYHGGFNEDAFRKSIAANYKAGKFVRGGSTITMQLVKNVFLTRHKTVSRKAEEALIVWLIENNRLTSKERMFEVYLNIIELGPGIYGIGEASRFYFAKRPSELNLAESVFLASLLPHPKWFKYSFDEQGNLKPYFADYYRVVANFLLKKNLITQNEYDRLQPRIELKGPAKNLITPVESVPKSEDQEGE